MVSNVFKESESSSFDLEVREFQVDKTLLSPLDAEDNDVPLDGWWTEMFRQGKYSYLSAMVKALMSRFHGPQVEGSFNTMEDIIDKKSCRMDIGTYNAIQTVKYALRTKEKGSVKPFSRKDFIMDPMDSKLYINMRTSNKRYREDLSKAEAMREENRHRLMIKLNMSHKYRDFPSRTPKIEV